MNFKMEAMRVKLLAMVFLASGVSSITNNGANLAGEMRSKDCSPRLEAALESRGPSSPGVDMTGFALHSPLRSAPFDMYVTDVKVKSSDKIARVEKCTYDPAAAALQARLGFREMSISGKVELVGGGGGEGRCNMTLRMRRAGLGFTVVPTRTARSARLGINTAATFVEPQFLSVHAYGCKGVEGGRRTRMSSERDEDELTQEMEEVFMRGVRSLLTRYMEARLEPALRDSLMMSLGYTISYGR